MNALNSLTSQWCTVLVEQSAIAIAILDQKLRYCLASRQWREVYNLPEAYHGQSHLDLFPHCPPHWQKAYERGLAGQIAENSGETVQLPNGTTVGLKWSVRPWREDNGDIGGVILQSEIIETREPENEFPNSPISHEQNWEQIFRLMPSMTGIAGFDGTLYQVNAAWEHTLGYAPQEVEGQSFLDFIHPDDYEASLAAAQQLQEGGQYLSFENRYRCRDGSYRWLAWTVTGVVEQQKIYAIARDVTDRKRAQAELEESKRLYQVLADTSPVGIFHTDTQGNCIYTNQQACILTGRSAQDLLENGWTQAMHERDRRRVLLEWTRQNDALFQSEFRFVRPDGTVRWVYAQCQSILNPCNPDEIMGYVGTCTDVTDRKRIEQDLRTSQEDLRTILNGVYDAIFIHDIDGQILEVNDPMLTMYGVSRAEAFQYSMTDYSEISPLLDYSSDLMERVMQGEDLQFEWKAKRPKDGLTFEVEVRLRKIRLNQQTVILANVRDITEFKKAEQEQMKLLSILEATPDFVGTADIQGRLTYLNQAGRQMVGIGKSEEISQYTMNDLVPPDYENQINPLALGSLMRREAWQGENVFLDQQGNEIPVSQVLMGHFDVTGVMEYTSTIARDIRDRKQAEAELMRYKQAVASTSDAIAITDAEGRVIYLNTAFTQLYHCQDLSDFRSRGGLSAIFADATVMQGLFGTVMNGQTWSHEVEHQTLDGDILQVFLRANAIRDEAENIVGLVAIINDISDRKAQEALLLEQQQTIRAILDNSPIWIWVTDTNGHMKFSNRAICADLGVTDEQFQAVGHYKELLGEDNCTPCLESDAACLAQDEPYFSTEHLNLADGQLHSLEVIKVRLKNACGEITGLVGFAVDATERKAQEAQLQKQLAAIESSVDGISIADTDGYCIYMNTAHAQMYGYETPEQLLGKHWKLFYDEEEQQRLEGIVPELLAKGQWRGETRGIRRDGTTFPQEVSLAVTADGWVCLVQDISDRKKAEAELLASKAQIQDQFEREQIINHLSNQLRSSIDVPEEEIIALALSELRRVLNIDRAHLSWYMKDAEESYWQVIAESRAEGLPDLTGRYPTSQLGPMAELLLRLEIVRIDNTNTVLDSVLRQILEELDYKSLLIVPLEMSSNKIGIVACSHSQAVRPWEDTEIELVKAVMNQLAIATNQASLYAQAQESAQMAQAKAEELEQTIRELHRTQAQLVQTEKMSSLGQLVAGVAHEINNPVNFIYGNLSHADDYLQDLLGLIDLYQQHYTSPVPEIAQEIEDIDLEFLLEDLPKLFSSMKVGADRIKAIVASLRTFSRMDEAEMKWVDIHEGLESTLMILQNRIKAKPEHPAIEIVKKYGDLQQVECYAGQLNQVFMNIIGNAIDALEERDRERDYQEIVENPSIISIRTAVIEDNTVQISIGDNGQGIPDKIKQRLFDPFFTTKSIGKGTGLGLSISYQIVTEKHGGTIECQSTIGEGTEFLITIPISQGGT
ncbi:PAS domain S-box protein [Spirulina sp. CS-785/01]|uniref:PAS domain S-box protein n=1 Tax=Spirulina sp. CS-785/01 TaxID=3021716 RepID=UPI00232E4334|nr:PAS domain S-box protein [Spirulina sp. CS-785/01]MDB9311834.1 PAS domain S-box protein [Spirulina sp. CS-785/01]